MPNGAGVLPVRFRAGFHPWFGFQLRFRFPPFGFRFPTSTLVSNFHLWFGFRSNCHFGFGFSVSRCSFPDGPFTLGSGLV